MVNGKKAKFIEAIKDDPKLDLRLFVQHLGVPIGQLQEWKNEIDGIEAPATVVEAIESLKEPEILEIDYVAGDIISSKELAKRNVEYSENKALRKAQTTAFATKIAKSEGLEGALNDSAVSLVSLIAMRIENIAQYTPHTVNGKTGGPIVPSYTKDLVELSAALAGIQNAFFNKATTINVNQENNTGMLNSFRANLKT